MQYSHSKDYEHALATDAVNVNVSCAHVVLLFFLQDTTEFTLHGLRYDTTSSQSLTMTVKVILPTAHASHPQYELTSHTSGDEPTSLRA